ncbi:bifunctional riboflavin kinase/FMN adenylyltransferase, partial [Herbaspirillum sp. HC18]
SALAIGNFDGVHRGHQALLKSARAVACSSGVPAAVMLFEPHPRELFAPGKAHFRLTTLPRKLELLESFGIDVAVVLNFDRSLADLAAETFIEQILVRDLAVSHVVVGYDFHFGKGRGGNPALLQQAGEKFG